MEQRFCTECGAPLEEGVRFCTECGAPVQTAAASEQPEQPAPVQPEQSAPVQPEQPVPVQPEQPVPVQPTGPAPRPVPVSAPEKPAKRKPLLGVRILLAIVSVLLCVLLFACLCAGGALYAARFIVAPETVDKVVDDLDLLHRDVRPFVKDMDIPADIPASEEVTVADLFYDAYKDAYSQYTEEQLTITREEMAQLLEESTLEEFIKDKLKDYLADATGNTGTGKITKEEILDLVKENEELISRAGGGYQLTEADYDAISAQLDKMKVTETLDLSVVRTQQEVPFRVAGYLTSRYALAAVGAVCLLWVLLLLAVNAYRVSNTLLYTGVALLAAGLVGMAFRLMQPFALRLVKEAASVDLSSLQPVIRDVTDPLWRAGLCAFGAGAVLILTFVLIRVVRSRRAKQA